MQTDDQLVALYRGVVMDHARAPRGTALPPSPPGVHEALDNPLCGDRVTVGVLGGVAAHDGLTVGASAVGCAIAVASASLLTEALNGRTRVEAAGLVAAFLALIRDQDALDVDLGDARALTAVAAFPARRRCATLAWEAADAALARSAR